MDGFTMELTEAESALGRVERFVRESDAIAGIKYDPAAPVTARHLDIAQIAVGFGMKGRCFKPISPNLINMALTGNTGPFYRSGVEFGRRGRVPDPDMLPYFVAEIEDDVARQFEESEKDAFHDLQGLAQFCWDMHDALACTFPYSAGNGRTARLYYIHLRNLFRLPFKVVLKEKEEGYWQHLEEYRLQKFPALATRAQERKEKAQQPVVVTG